MSNNNDIKIGIAIITLIGVGCVWALIYFWGK